MIDPATQQHLRQKYNPDGSELRTYQLRTLEILKYIDEICRKHNIKYWASSGTCLGAVRHAGFIPWDDDADLELTLDDFRRLRKAIIEDNNPRFRFYDHSIDSEYVSQFAKVVDTQPFSVSNPHKSLFSQYHKYNGPFVDIFILAPSNSRIFNRLTAYAQSLFLFRLNSIPNKFVRRLLKNVNYTLLSKVVFPVCRTMLKPFSNGNYRHTPGVEYTILRKKEEFENVVYTKFEDFQIPIPEKSHEYLTRLFGDYMQLPSSDQFRSHVIEIKDEEE